MRFQVSLFLGLVFFLSGVSAFAQGRGRAARAAGPSSRAGQHSFRAGPRVSSSFSSRQPARFSTPGRRLPHGQRLNHWPYFHGAFGSGWNNYGSYGYHPDSPYVAPSFGWPYSGYGYYGSPYTYAPQQTYSPYFPYLYFYDLYYQESQRSKEEADQFEASFGREQSGDSATPRSAKPGDDASGTVPLAPREVLVTIDGQELTSSASGGPVVLSSGHHTLRIAARSSRTTQKNRP
jgi:hypothetical protein